MPQPAAQLQQCASQRDRAKRTGAAVSKRAPANSLLQWQQRIGNRALGQLIQAKLKVSEPGDAYEQEADYVADAVLNISDSQAKPAAGPQQVQAPKLQRACAKCEEEEEKLHRKPTEQAPSLQAKEVSGARPHASSAAAALGNHSQDGGQALAQSVRDYFEPRFGYDFSQVRVHRDAQAAESAQAVNALAYTVGRDIVFVAGQYSPETSAGRRLLAHELTHTIQQGMSAAHLSRRENVAAKPPPADAHSAPQTNPLPIHERVEPAIIARRLNPSMCASDCEMFDGTAGPQTDFTLTIYADKEGPFLLIPFTHDVGHSWLKLMDKDGNYWTYGFWPQTGFDPSNASKDVEGCVHHPDTAHTPNASQTFKLTAAQFAAAKAKAVSICQTKPKYNLFGLQCTSFVRQVLAAAGKAPAAGFGLIWDSPNALHSWIKSNSLVIGASFTAATSAPGGAGAGGFGLDISYTHQFYSVLGEKLRFHWSSRGELSSRLATVSTGIGAELTSQRVFLPSAYVFGGGIMGGMTPNFPGVQPEGFGAGMRFGAGLTGAAGLRFKVDEFMTIGVEYNLIKDFVDKDPLLNRLMLRAGLTF